MLSLQELYNKGLWRTSSGAIMKFRDMDSQHIENTIKMIIRKTESGLYRDDVREINSKYVKALKKELKFRCKKINIHKPKIEQNIPNIIIIPE